MPSIFSVAQMTDISEFILAARCAKRKTPELAARLFAEKAERLAKLLMIIECAPYCQRPTVLLAALRFAGPLSRHEIALVLRRQPNLEDLDNEDCDLNDPDLGLDRLAQLGFAVRSSKALRLSTECVVREFEVFELIGGAR